MDAKGGSVPEKNKTKRSQCDKLTATSPSKLKTRTPAEEALWWRVSAENLKAYKENRA